MSGDKIGEKIGDNNGDKKIGRSGDKELKFKIREDYLKPQVDFFKKTFVSGSWTFDSKLKGPADTLYVNPKFDQKKGFNADFQYDNTHTFPLKTKLNLNAIGDWKQTTQFNLQPFNFELELEKGKDEGDKCCPNADLTVEYKHVPFTFVNKLSRTNVESTAFYKAAANCEVGLFTLLNLSNIKEAIYGIGIRYNNGCCSVSAFARNNKDLSFGFTFPTTILDHKLSFTSAIDTENLGTIKSADFGAEVALCSCASLRARVDYAKGFALCLISRLPNSITAAITIGTPIPEKAKEGATAPAVTPVVTSSVTPAAPKKPKFVFGVSLVQESEPPKPKEAPKVVEAAKTFETPKLRSGR